MNIPWKKIIMIAWISLLVVCLIVFGLMWINGGLYLASAQYTEQITFARRVKTNGMWGFIITVIPTLATLGFYIYNKLHNQSS